MRFYWRHWAKNKRRASRDKYVITSLLCISLMMGLIACSDDVLPDPSPSLNPIPTESPNPTLEPPKSIEDYKTMSMNLYFPDIGGKKLIMQPRNASISSATPPELAVMQQLLMGPMDEMMRPIIPEELEVSIERVDRSDDMVMVYLSKEFRDLTGLQMLLARLAIINSLTELPGITYCNIFAGGREAGLDGHPFDVSGKYAGDPLGYWLLWKNDLETRMQAIEDANAPAVAEQRSMILYYLDSSGQYLMPEVRSVLVEQEQYIDAILQELRKGSMDKVNRLPVFADSITFRRDPQVIAQEDGTDRLVLYLDESAGDFFMHYSEQKLPFLGSIVMSVTQFMPNISTVQFYIGDSPMEDIAGITTDTMKDGCMERGMFAEEMLGNTVMLYFPNSGLTALLPVYRALHYKQGQSPRGLLLELLSGPRRDEDEDAISALSSRITKEDIISAVIQEDTAVVNVTDHFRAICRTLSAPQERMLIYSMVNTLTRLEGVNRVQFLVDGKVATGLFGNNISVESPLIANPGIVQK